MVQQMVQQMERLRPIENARMSTACVPPLRDRYLKQQELDAARVLEDASAPNGPYHYVCALGCRGEAAVTRARMWCRVHRVRPRMPPSSRTLCG